MLKRLQPFKLASAGLLLMSLSLCATSVSAQDDVCEYDEAEMLALDPWDFDQDPDKGWRQFEGREECVEVVADLIRTFYENREMPAGFRRLMMWHEGQFRAEADQNKAAIALFKQARDPEEESTRWNYYVDASIAFLENDMDALKANREKLAAVPKPDDFNPVDADGNDIDVTWPPNLHIVDNLIECFGENYIVASGGCDSE